MNIRISFLKGFNPYPWLAPIILFSPYRRKDNIQCHKNTKIFLQFWKQDLNLKMNSLYNLLKNMHVVGQGFFALFQN
jgi:alanine-alpha-ketoisovalerate/valine-pyruvate aminotransferase